MDFNALTGYPVIGTVHIEDGFKLTATSYEIQYTTYAYGGDSYGAIVFSNYSGGEIWTITREDGGLFDLSHMGVSEINAYMSAQTLNFTGTKADTSTVTQSYTTNGPGSLPLETLIFTGFTDLVSVSWDRKFTV
jgi:hypothetical protein